jgi:amidohydrolase
LPVILDAWAGTLVLIFQPGEETAAGALAMLDDGLWDRAPRPEVVFGQHVMPRPVGTVAISSGPVAAMADSLRVTVHGQQSHGSQPQDSIDPIVMAAHMVTRLQGIVSRELDPRKSAVVTVGTFHAGLKENIIPASAEFTLNIRTFDEDVRGRSWPRFAASSRPKLPPPGRRTGHRGDVPLPAMLQRSRRRPFGY